MLMVCTCFSLVILVPHLSLVRGGCGSQIGSTANLILHIRGHPLSTSAEFLEFLTPPPLSANSLNLPYWALVLNWLCCMDSRFYLIIMRHAFCLGWLIYRTKKVNSCIRLKYGKYQLPQLNTTEEPRIANMANLIVHIKGHSLSTSAEF